MACYLFKTYLRLPARNIFRYWGNFQDLFAFPIAKYFHPVMKTSISVFRVQYVEEIETSEYVTIMIICSR